MAADVRTGGKCYDRKYFPRSGPVAQLGARFHGMEEVVSSNLTRSTKFLKNLDSPRLSAAVKKHRTEIGVKIGFNG
jgi:hypothetical protein